MSLILLFASLVRDAAVLSGLLMIASLPPQNPDFASKFCGFTGQVHSVLQYLWLKCLDHSFEFSDTEYDLHSTKCMILSTFNSHFADWKEILSQPRELCWCFRMVLPCLRNWSTMELLITSCHIQDSACSTLVGWALGSCYGHCHWWCSHGIESCGCGALTWEGMPR